MKKKKLTERDKQFLIQQIQKGEDIPPDFKYKLFPTLQKEYELVYAGKMRKEDILADEDGVTAVPLQVEKTYNGDRDLFDDGWKNMIVFGDNLQFLKTLYKNEDPLIKNKVKGKVKLIYIDPPFASQADFKSKSGQKAYVDKSKGSEFLEFLRRRLIVAKELLSPDGSIFVHLDWRKAQYTKVILDEVFGENKFLNEIIWNYSGGRVGKKFFGRKHDNIFWYSANYGEQTFNYDDVRQEYSQTTLNRNKYTNTGSSTRILDYAPNKKGKFPEDVWNISIINPFSKERIDYPTQKPEKLLEQVLLAASNEGDLILDFFGGSGTTAAVAEKLGRKWIVCDIGKLSFYTIQKRILSIQNTKSLGGTDKLYQKKAKSFQTINTGLYDLPKLFELQKEDYIQFVMNLFEVTPKNKTIGGISINGERSDGYYALIWEYWKFPDAAIDETFLEHLDSSIGNRLGDRLYIIAPANKVQFIDDYYEIGDVKYYFLKVPYQIITELHKAKFKKFRQPTNKDNVNALEDAVGFHFIRQPEVESSFNKGVLKITEFLAYCPDEETGDDIPDFEALAMIIIDKDYDGKEFIMSEAFFAEDLLKDKSKSIEIKLNSYGKKIGVTYVDIYGNEFREELKTK